MKYNWEIKSLADIVQLNPKESIAKGTIAKKVPMDKLHPFCRDIPEYIFEKFNGGTKFRNGDTIMARITPCLENGKTAKVDILNDGEIGFGSTEYIVFRAIDGISDADYLYYLICSPSVRNPAIKSMIGSSGRQRVQIDVIENLQIEVPPLEGQRKIGSLLKSLDDKIALNNRINDNLQQQAQAIYHEHFESVKSGNLPSEWRIVKLGEIALISKQIFNPSKEPETMLEHYSIPAFDEAKFPVFELSTTIKSNKYIIDKDCYLISKLNPTTKRVWKPYCLSNNAVCSTEFVVYKAKDNNITDFIFAVIDSLSFSDFMCSHVTGSTGSRQRTTPSDTLAFELFLPSKKEMADFQATVAPIYTQMQVNAIINDKLKRLRDTLLPKLISGEVDVSSIDL